MQPQHRPDDVRETFLDAVEAYWFWSRRGAALPPPTLVRDIQSGSHPISLAQACRLVWHCSDILPGSAFDMIERVGLQPGRRTYAAAARTMHAALLRICRSGQSHDRSSDERLGVVVSLEAATSAKAGQGG